MQGCICVYVEQCKRVYSTADTGFVRRKFTKISVLVQAFTHRKYLIVEVFLGVYLCIVMKKCNVKNLRREVQRQLKELRGRVGENAVSEQTKFATKAMTKTDSDGESFNFAFPFGQRPLVRASTFGSHFHSFCLCALLS